jgi:hypothetical protein
MLFNRMSERAEPGGDAEPHTITLRSSPFHDYHHHSTVYRQDISHSITTENALSTKFPGMSDHNAIRNAISLYCIALDNKDWTLLEKVFDKDVVAVYPFNDEPILGVDALSKRIQQR